MPNLQQVGVKATCLGRTGKERRRLIVLEKEESQGRADGEVEDKKEVNGGTCGASQRTEFAGL